MFHVFVLVYIWIQCKTGGIKSQPIWCIYLTNHPCYATMQA
nr:MAG TPA: hypothetical protein [Caudoviricetes sp.]DAT02649.1 MAG TPA: hypothetical protein [Caudoviricetes sp.]